MINVLRDNTVNNYNRDNLDRQAEREGIALKQQGQNVNQQHKRHKIKAEYNKSKFDKLFKS